MTALDTLFLMALIINKGKWLLVAFLPLWYNERPSMSITVFLFPVPVQLTFRLIFCIIRRNKARWAKVFAHSIAQLVKRHWGSEMLSLAAQIHEYKGG